MNTLRNAPCLCAPRVIGTNPDCPVHGLSDRAVKRREIDEATAEVINEALYSNPTEGEFRAIMQAAIRADAKATAYQAALHKIGTFVTGLPHAPTPDGCWSCSVARMVEEALAQQWEGVYKK